MILLAILANVLKVIIFEGIFLGVQANRLDPLGVQANRLDPYCFCKDSSYYSPVEVGPQPKP